MRHGDNPPAPSEYAEHCHLCGKGTLHPTVVVLEGNRVFAFCSDSCRITWQWKRKQIQERIANAQKN